MPLLVEISHQHPAAAVVVGQDGGDGGQLWISAVDEDQAHPPIDQLLIQVQIGVGQGGLAPLHQYAVQILDGQQGLEDLALDRDLILGGEEEGGAAVGGKDPLHPPEDPREDVVIDIGGDHRDRTVQKGLRPDPFPQVGSAALPAGDQPLVLQHRQGPADRLPADLEPLAEGVLRREELLAAVYAILDLLAQRVGDGLIFRRHRPPSFLGDPGSHLQQTGSKRWGPVCIIGPL